MRLDELRKVLRRNLIDALRGHVRVNPGEDTAGERASNILESHTGETQAGFLDGCIVFGDEDDGGINAEETRSPRCELSREAYVNRARYVCSGKLDWRAGVENNSA